MTITEERGSSMSPESTLVGRDDDVGIGVHRAGGVLTLSINRPKTRNALTEADVDRLIVELTLVNDCTTDRAVLLTGRNASFCAGFDLAVPLKRSMPRFMRRVGELVEVLHELPVPTVAAVRGPAAGLGFSLALACDLIIASADAYFLLPFHSRGLVLDGGASWLLPNRIGIGRAKEVAFLGERIDAVRALSLGVVNAIADGSDFDSVSESWMQKLVSGPPAAQRMSKELVNLSCTTTLRAALIAEANAQSVAFQGREAKEGVKAFMSKRMPVFPDA